MKDIQLLANADQILSKCGRPLRSSDGTVFLPLGRKFFFQANHAPGTTETESREIYGDTVYMLRSVGIVPPVNELYWRLEFPSGRYLQNVNRTMSQVANVGSERYPLTPDVPCSPGSRLLVTLDDRPTNGGAGAGSITPVQMVFGGAYLYALRGSQVQPVNPIRDAGLMKRYFDTVNQNILAPEIAISLENDSTPAGFVDSEFTYCDPLPVSPGVQLASTGSLSVTRNVLISGIAFFVVRRLMFRLKAVGDGLTGTLLVRVRDSAGFNFTNDYIKVSQFNNAPYACDWPVCAGSTLIFDFAIVDQVGTGTWQIQTFIKGIRRRRAA